MLDTRSIGALLMIVQPTPAAGKRIAPINRNCLRWLIRFHRQRINDTDAVPALPVVRHDVEGKAESALIGAAVVADERQTSERESGRNTSDAAALIHANC